MRPLVAALTFFFLAVPGLRAATNDIFAEGIKTAGAGDYFEAAANFSADAIAHPSVGAWLNLGVVEWQAGHAGKAILAWERAAWIAPGDARVKNNLKLARAITQQEPVELRWFEKISTALPFHFWPWLAGAGLWLVAVLLLIPRVLRWQKPAWQQPLVALGICLFILSLTGSIGVASRADLGVVTAKNTLLRLTPTRGSEVISALNAGESFRVLRSRGNYLFIRTPMTAGWVERGQVGMICE